MNDEQARIPGVHGGAPGGGPAILSKGRSPVRLHWPERTDLAGPLHLRHVGVRDRGEVLRDWDVP